MPRTLDTYNSKRDFRKTPEPAGKPEKAADAPDKPLRFVVQHHAASRDHYDFRLEWEGVLLSWAVPKGPSYNTRDKRLAVAVEDHPLEYREFEGTIAEGEYGGGTVMLWDEGYWEPLVDVTEGLARGSLKFVLDGLRLHGRWALVQMKGRAGGNGENWLLIKEKDEFAQADDGVSGFTVSVRSGRTMAEIAGKPENEPAPEAKPGKDQTKSRASGKESSKGGSSGKDSTARTSVLIEQVRLTSPDRILFAGTDITKEAVARYYLKVADRMRPFFEKRILHFLRCPGGAPGSCFFQRHLERQAEGLGTLEVKAKDGSLDDYFYIENDAGLVSAIQMGTVELHVWGSRVDQLETPDWMVFDLDPDEGLGLEHIRQGVLDVRQALADCGLTAFLKTSGGKGYHIVVPLEPAADWEAVQAFAKRVAEDMEKRWPARYTSSTSKAKRKGKIYVDWLRNGRGASSVAPYSLRARAGGPVSMPIAWDELETVAPADIDLAEALRRLGTEDPWKAFFTTRQKLD